MPLSPKPRLKRLGLPKHCCRRRFQSPQHSPPPRPRVHATAQTKLWPASATHLAIAAATLSFWQQEYAPLRPQTERRRGPHRSMRQQLTMSVTKCQCGGGRIGKGGCASRRNIGLRLSIVKRKAESAAAAAAAAPPAASIPPTTFSASSTHCLSFCSATLSLSSLPPLPLKPPYHLNSASAAASSSSGRSVASSPPSCALSPYVAQ
jgi:hypothetical protein